MISVLSVNYHPSDRVISVLSVNYHPSDRVISVLSVNYHPSGRVFSIKSQLYIPSPENNFPPVASAPAEATQYAAANFNLSSEYHLYPGIRYEGLKTNSVSYDDVKLIQY